MKSLTNIWMRLIEAEPYGFGAILMAATSVADSIGRDGTKRIADLCLQILSKLVWCLPY